MAAERLSRPTAEPKVDRTIRLRDGRALAYSEWGDLGGRPVILLHGNPGSRLFCPDEEATKAAGVRLLTIDRPGYGQSDPKPGRTLLSWVDDYLEFAGQLGLPPSPIIGWSGGGRYALAAAFRAPDLVPTIGVAAGRGPLEEVPGALDALSREDRAIVELLGRDPAAARVAIAQDLAWLEGDGWQTMFATGQDLRSWGEADDHVLAQPSALEAMKAMMREAARQGSAGYQGDLAAGWLPWGFSVSDIRLPVWIWWGESDIDTDRHGSDYLAATIPGATLVTYPGEGHLVPINRWADMLAALS
jgi:pimeloyl-ACP methyl ester carboxylesterase